MFDEIVFTSSFSSQLGALISLNKFFSDQKSKIIFRKILVIHLSSKGDKDCQYSCFKEFGELIIGKNLSLKEIKINNLLKRLILFFFLNVFSLLNIKKNINIWQPSPYWINNLFKFKKIDLNILKNYFKNTKCYGDGFLCLSYKSIPFWLSEINVSFEQNFSGTFYYLYEMNKFKNNRSKFIKLEAKYVRKILYKLKHQILKTEKKENKNNRIKNLLIFPLTTFSETGRSTIDAEINLYIDYIKANVDRDNVSILVKPHPGSFDLKTDLLIEKLKKLNYIVINSKFIKNKISQLPLNVLPLELLCLLIVSKFNLSFNEIRLCINSNASLSTFYLFPEIKYLKPFGAKLISKYIHKGFVDKRLKQEELLINKIYGN